MDFKVINLNSKKAAEIVIGLVTGVGGHIEELTSKAKSKKNSCNCFMCGSKAEKEEVKEEVKEGSIELHEPTSDDVQLLRGLVRESKERVYNEYAQFMSKECLALYHDFLEKAKEEANAGNIGMQYVYPGNIKYIKVFIETLVDVGFRCDFSNSKPDEYTLSIVWDY